MLNLYSKPNKRQIKDVRVAPAAKHWFICPLLALALVPPATAEEKIPPIHLEADRIESIGELMRADGNVEARFDGYKLCAGNIEYDRNTGLIKAVREVRLVRRSSEITGERADYDSQSGSGSITSFETSHTGSGLRASGKKATWQQNGITATDADITSCPQESEDWRLHAGEFQIIEDEQQLIVRNTTLWVAGFPLLYLPYGRFYYGDEKKTGFLPPHLRFGSGSNTGFNLPYYLALADNYDLTLTPNYRSSHGLELGSEFRFLTAESSGNLQVATTLLDDSGRGREKLSYNYHSGNWRGELEAENVSDNDYLRHYVGGDARSTRTLPRTAALHYEQDNFYARAAVEHFKSLDNSLTAPHRAVPQIDLGALGGRGIYDWETSLQYARFQHNTADGGARNVWRGNLRGYQHIGDISLSPAIGAHAVKYHASDDGNDTSFFVPHVRLDAEKNSHNLFASGDGQRDHLRLRSAVVYTPTRKRQNQAPLYDTAVREQNSENLFEWNRFVGDDRAADSKFLAYGGSYRLFAGDNEQFFIGIAQRYHLSDVKISLPQDDIPPPQGFGNILLNSHLQLHKIWEATAAAEWDAQNTTLQRFYTEVHGRFTPKKLLRLRYLADDDESIIIGGAAPITPWLEAAAQTDYLLNQDRFAQSHLALRLRDSCDCWNISFTVTDTVVDKGDNDTRFSLGMEFTGLGNIGSDYESLLDRIR